MTQQTIQIILEVCAVLFIFYLAFFKSYFQEKGKNLATREDLEEITRVVEGIKADFTKEAESMKVQLAFISQNRFSIRQAERDALFDFNLKYSAWLHTLIRFDFITYSEDNFKDLNNVLRIINEKQYEFDLSEFHLRLFMHDQTLVEIINDLSSLTIDLASITNTSIVEIIALYRMYNFEIKFESENKVERINKLAVDLEKETLDFNEKRLQVIKKIYLKRKELTRLIKGRIDSIGIED